MRLIKLIIIVILFSQIFSDGRTLPVFAGGFNGAFPVFVENWQKQTIIDKDIIIKSVMGQEKVRMIAFLLPEIKPLSDIDKRAEELYRLKQKVQCNI